MKFAIAMVTYNRLSCLKKAIKCYEEQSYKPTYIVIVDNCSTDGTDVFLKDWMKVPSELHKLVVTTESNLGGSGGFYRALDTAENIDCDFVFLADDDAYADRDMLKYLMDYYSAYPEQNKIAALCTKNINQGKIDTMHRRRIYRGLVSLKQVWLDESYYNSQAFEVEELSFVGAAIKREVINNIGLPKQEYFIYYDDTEYSARIRSMGKIMCVSASTMYHDSPAPDGSFSWKTYYVVRNEIDSIKSHFPKRYYYYSVVSHYIKNVSVASLLKKRTKQERRMCKTAIEDAIHGRLGKNPDFLPKK